MNLPANEDLVLYAVVSLPALKRMNGNRGKLAAQAGHAFVHALWDAGERHPGLVEDYRASPHARKIVLACGDEVLMRSLVEHYRPLCGVTEVVDAGFTVFKEPTFTMIGIGPIAPSKREDVLKGLAVLI